MRTEFSKYVVPMLTLALLFLCACTNEEISTSREYDFVIAIHGGAGTIKRESMSSDREA